MQELELNSHAKESEREVVLALKKLTGVALVSGIAAELMLINRLMLCGSMWSIRLLQLQLFLHFSRGDS